MTDERAGSLNQDRRIAQWQSASIHTEEGAAFKSCSAYQTPPHLLFLSHCVPYPPDKGDRIRAHHLLKRLNLEYSVHVACFARTPAEVDAARHLDGCASLYVEHLPPTLGLAKGGFGFLAGRCLTESFFSSGRLRRYLAQLQLRTPLAASVVYSSAMAQYAAPNAPLLLDMVDVDSEKWLQYARMRHPGPLYRIEGHRLREIEAAAARRAVCTFFATEPERQLFQGFAPQAESACMENGVDFGFFDPQAASSPGGLAGRRFVVFLGAMDYFPNADAACWFAQRVLPEIRRTDAAFEFWIVGRNPASRVKRLARLPGVTVTGAVPDVRPYLAAASALVAPLRIARGIQNKILEALAMGKPVLASAAACDAFGRELPSGVLRCHSPRDYGDACRNTDSNGYRVEIRDAARRRFSWEDNLERFRGRLQQALSTGTQTVATASR